MPRSFNENELASIRERLRHEGARLFGETGVLKTSVEQLATSAGIAKGSFYKFYDTKELLYFELLEDAQNRIRAPLLTGTARSRGVFEKQLRALFAQICDDPLVQIMGRETERIAITNRIPAKRLLAHQTQDQQFLDALIARWNMKKSPPKRDVVAARITLLMMLSLQRDFFGDRLFGPAVDTVISTIGDCLFGVRPAKQV